MAEEPTQDGGEFERLEIFDPRFERGDAITLPPGLLAEFEEPCPEQSLPTHGVLDQHADRLVGLHRETDTEIARPRPAVLPRVEAEMLDQRAFADEDSPSRFRQMMAEPPVPTLTGTDRRVDFRGQIPIPQGPRRTDGGLGHQSVEAIENGKVAQGQSPVAAKRPMRRTVTL